GCTSLFGSSTSIPMSSAITERPASLTSQSLKSVSLAQISRKFVTGIRLPILVTALLPDHHPEPCGLSLHCLEPATSFHRELVALDAKLCAHTTLISQMSVIKTTLHRPAGYARNFADE